MITLNKLKIFAKYKGDGDMWTRMSHQETNTITADEWALIDTLIQDWIIVENGCASEEYIANFNKRLVENFDGIGTIELLKSLTK